MFNMGNLLPFGNHIYEGEVMKQPYVWPESVRAAFCFTIDVDAESPQLWRNRKQPSLSMNELEQRFYGLREGIWNLLDLLARYEVRATCFVPVHEAVTRPWLLETLVKAGHEIGLHGVLHEVVSELTRDQFAEIVEKGLETVVQYTGKKPSGFRSPAWEMTPWAFDVLHKAGIAYDSSLSGNDHPYSLGDTTEIPIQWPLDDAVFFRYAGTGADRWAPRSTADTADSWLNVCESIERFGGSVVTTVHPWLTGRSYRTGLAESLLKHARNTPGLWICTAGELAAYHASSQNYENFMEELNPPFLSQGRPTQPKENSHA